MSRYLLDTDMITLAQFGNRVVEGNLVAHAASYIAISAISIQEQMDGWLGHLNRLNTPPRLAAWYDRLVSHILPSWKRFTVLTVSEPAILRSRYLKSLRLSIGSMDLRIAAVALENGLTVITRNCRDFGRVPGLATDDWSV
jgi:tRNA(fMet)-specific endonuclease VapC